MLHMSDFSWQLRILTTMSLITTSIMEQVSSFSLLIVLQILSTDVVQAIYFMLQKTKLGECIPRETQITMLIAGAVHDLGHRGRSNNYEIDSQSGLALRYNDISVLENHHVALAFRLMQNESCNIIEDMTREKRKVFRDRLIKMVLGTDMKNHFGHVASLQKALEGHKQKQTWFSESDPVDQEHLFVNAVHLADISSSCKPARIAVEWTARLEKEWFDEGDDQRNLDLPVGPMNDRNKPNTAKSQAGFLKFLVEPLVKVFSDIVGDGISPIIQNLQLNHQFWLFKIEAAEPISENKVERKSRE
jgi:cAMP-specific phosphodiesterase 4